MKTDINLPIDKKWFNMILAGIKKEEYREVKPYWTKRIEKACAKETISKQCDPPQLTVKFINGYGDRPYFIAQCEILIKNNCGNPYWGAIPDTNYYVFKILSIVETYKCDQTKKDFLIVAHKIIDTNTCIATECVDCPNGFDGVCPTINYNKGIAAQMKYRVKILNEFIKENENEGN